MKISTLLEKFEDQMEAVSYSENTKTTYRSCIVAFLDRFKECDSPKHISSDDVLKYLLEKKEGNTRKHHHCAIKVFYKRVVHQPFKFNFIPYGKKVKRLPIIIDQPDVQKLFDVCDNLKHKTIMAVFYGTGIRRAELINIKLTDIRRQQEVIRIIGKGNKERLVPLNAKLLELLEQYWFEYRPKFWLFENDDTHEQYSVSSIRSFLNSFKAKAGVTSPVTPHKFRHSHATALLESGVDIRIIQKELGHWSIKTTIGYTHVSKSLVSKIKSPINDITITTQPKVLPVQSHQ
jgi:site-specific recombinase XerD